ncbi:hypothetical protein RJ641_025358 [Dillenia turbinata]|uniref:Uncharacterized protein n=1 Tax=Dillenia turbinata TaxID=194707 RepID=A0AAN8W975_9MAGN
MEVFSPLMEVHPITPSLDKLWDSIERESADKKPSLLLFLSSSWRFALSDEAANDLPIFEWRPGSIPKQDDSHSSFTPLVSTRTSSSKSKDSSVVTPPEAQGGERLSNRFLHLRQQFNMPFHFGMLTSAVYP